MRNAGPDEAQAGIQIAGRNINNLRYADDTTLMAESEEELQTLLMTVKDESENSWLKAHIQKKKIRASGPIGSVQFSSVQSLSRVQLFVTPQIAARQASLSITNSRSSLRLTSIKSAMSSIQPSHPWSSPSSPSAPNPSQHQSFPMKQIYA